MWCWEDGGVWGRNEMMMWQRVGEGERDGEDRVWHTPSRTNMQIFAQILTSILAVAWSDLIQRSKESLQEISMWNEILHSALVLMQARIKCMQESHSEVSAVKLQDLLKDSLKFWFQLVKARNERNDEFWGTGQDRKWRQNLIKWSFIVNWSHCYVSFDLIKFTESLRNLFSFQQSEIAVQIAEWKIVQMFSTEGW